jgi:hypothetical protein
MLYTQPRSPGSDTPRYGIGSRHHPYASVKVDYTKGIIKVQGIKLWFPMHAQQQVYRLPNSELGPFPHSGLLVQHTPSKTTKSMQGLVLLAPQLPYAGSQR